MSDGPDLPRPTPPFDGEVARLIAEATPRRLERSGAPAGAPNVLLVMLDDVGFGSFSTFGGPVPTPAFQRIADRGLTYNRFHTTALCSPTRAALLTGRQHHAVHMGGITEIANSFPGYDSAIPAEAATVAQVLRMHGYATGCFGKWHLTPLWEQGPAGPFDRWPTGMGFDRFYGILGAESSQWEPPVYDQTTPIQPHLGREGYHLSEDLADQAITWIQRHHAAAPDRPFFCYFATPAVHAPHHAPKEWVDRFAGAFDEGWDALRRHIFERQLASGVIPEDTQLTERPEQIPAWDDYPERFRPVATRLMECFAGFLAHTDAQIGRVIDAIDDLGPCDGALLADVLHHVPHEAQILLLRAIGAQMPRRAWTLIIKDVAPGGIRSRMALLADHYISGDRGVRFLTPGDVDELVRAVWPTAVAHPTRLLEIDRPNYCTAYTIDV